MSGLHPTNVKENYKEELEFVVNSLKSHSYVAIGEIGIDLYWDKTYLKQQQDAFEFQIRLAIKNDLPIVIHCREAFDEIFEILDKENCTKLRGVFHCFTGTLNQANRAIRLGFKLGIGGVVTFKNGGIDKFLSQIDLKHIVLETDSPYLAPVPFRGKRNESSYITYVIDKLSEIYGLPIKKIASETTKNAEKVFAL
jgi:TatD DNase family protein